MENILIFFTQFGFPLTLIAIAGIVLLGILKYNNVFNKIPKENRKTLYFLISVGFSLFGAGIYLGIVGAFAAQTLGVMGAATYALNQTFYAIYDTTTLKDLWNKILDFGINFLKTKFLTKE